ncbi:MAG TPA: aldehyde dehydrogenase family protein, partial [Solirubrobacteraceae bacterium]
MATVEQQATSTNGAATGATFDVENPATGEVVATLPDMSAEQVHEMALKGRAVQPAWEALGYEGRARVFLRMQKWLADNSERVIDVVISETGKAYEDAQIADWSNGLSTTGFWAKHAEKYLADERVRSGSPFVKGKKLMLRYRPLGLVGIIGPWNYPLANSFGDAIPALMAGNSVIIKPSEITPLTSLLMEECMRESGLPEFLYQVAPGYGETGAALIDEADMIMFTGSTATGKKVMQKAAETLTPVSLELGGKDPLIVLADADLERAANGAVYYSMQNGGQTCISIERA